MKRKEIIIEQLVPRDIESSRRLSAVSPVLMRGRNLDVTLPDVKRVKTAGVATLQTIKKAGADD